VNLEGELQLTLRLGDGQISGIRLTSTRPDVAVSLLQGRNRSEVQAAVPLLFSVCARSQAAACRLACASAAGETLAAGDLAQMRADVGAEVVRETALQCLLQWPRWLGEEPGNQAAVAARAAMGWRGAKGLRGDPPARAALAQDIALAVFGMPAAQWLDFTSWSAVTAWAAAGSTASARHIHLLQGAPADARDAGHTPDLPAPAPGWLAQVAHAAAADAAFARQPTWQGAPAETGALSRLHADALLGRTQPAPPSRGLARHLARLRELALLLCGSAAPALGALALGPGSALAWVDNARGLLIHHVQLQGEALRLYRIVAPTEWNFHPRGALARALVGAAVADGSAALQLATQVVRSLDPCVACQVLLETTDHA